MLKLKKLLMVFAAASLFGSVGCKTWSFGSDTKITNGRPLAANEYPAVVMLYRYDDVDQSENGYCTGTFLSPTLVLTAAHCVKGELSEQGFVRDYSYIRVNKVPAKRVFRHAAWIHGAASRHRYDLALIELEQAASEAVMEISAKPAEVGDSIVVTGYGRHDAENSLTSGDKRIGENSLSDREEGVLVFNGVIRGSDFDGVDSASAAGDSGGPMFVNGAIVGVTSAGEIKNSRKYSYYTDISSSYSKTFFKAAIAAGVEVPLPIGYLQQ